MNGHPKVQSNDRIERGVRSQSFVGGEANIPNFPFTNGSGLNAVNGVNGINNLTDGLSNREELKIKDLLVKIQILRNGVIEERNKNSEMEKEMSKIKAQLAEHEKIINEKENLIITLSKEKYELQSKIDIEKQKTEAVSMSNQFSNLVTGIFGRKEAVTSLNEQELKKLQNEKSDLQLENEILKKKVEDQSLDFERCKIEYQKLINLQVEKMKKLENTILEKNKLIEQNDKKFEIMCDNLKKSDIKKTKYESDISEMKKENKELEERIVELLLKLEDNEKIIAGNRESLHRHEIESAELARKLAELKNAIIESNMVIQNFKCEKIGKLYNTAIEITFGRTDDNEYVMIVKEDDEEEYVNVEDIEYMKTSEKFIDLIDICYLVRVFNSI